MVQLSANKSTPSRDIRPLLQPSITLRSRKRVVFDPEIFLDFWQYYIYNIWIPNDDCRNYDFCTEKATKNSECQNTQNEPQLPG